MTLKDNYLKIKSKIPSSVTLIAVSKTKPIHMIQELYELGQRDFGENYVQELEQKAEYLHSKGIKDINWHFIGHLQTNKVKQLIPHVSVIHTVDRVSLIQELKKRRGLSEKKDISLFMQVNIDDEESKSGVSKDEARNLWGELIQLKEYLACGLMCIPDPSVKEEGISYSRCAELSRSIDPHYPWKFSMGMSNDFEVAIKQGATHVRVGSSLFGQRN